MTASMRRIATASFIVLGVIAVWLTAQQTIAGSDYSTDPRNVRALPDPDDPRRGPITSSDGIVLAEDVDGVRVYPAGSAYLHLVGVTGDGISTGIESTRATELGPLDDESLSAWLVQLFGGNVDPPEVRLTVDSRVQDAAVAGLVGRTGAVIAIEPSSGAILAYAASPTVDPNPVSAGERSGESFLTDSASLDRVAFRLLPPGSTFKVLIAAAALEQGFGTESVFSDTAEYLAPGSGQPITNVGGAACTDGGEITLREALAVSCNTVFAELAVELGGATVNDIAQRAGLNAVLDFELGAAISSLPSAAQLDADPGALAQTGLGERDVRVTPLQLAIVAAALGNGGEMMQPYVVERVVSRDGSTLTTTSPVSLGALVAPAVAGDVASMMLDVVASGTGRAGAVAGVAVAGKTGTAEGAGGPHSWFIALAPAADPRIAVIVVVEGEGTGGTTAAPIASSVIAAWLGA